MSFFFGGNILSLLNLNRYWFILYLLFNLFIDQLGERTWVLLHQELGLTWM